jgi:hypothetical protein
MVICKCYKCYIQTDNFVLIKIDNNYQSICSECYNKKNCFMEIFSTMKKLCCCCKKTTEAVSDAHTDLSVYN